MPTSHFHIAGLSCNKCKQKALTALEKLAEVETVTIDLENKTVDLETKQPVAFLVLQEALRLSNPNYKLSLPTIDGAPTSPVVTKVSATKTSNDDSAGYYCPMHCEGDMIYPEPGSCPVCGMDILPVVSGLPSQVFTCPKHPEVEQSSFGNCPICGDELIAKAPEASAEELAYLELRKKMWITSGFAIPLFIISMGEMIPGNPIPHLLPQQTWNWIQLILCIPVVWICRVFFERAWTSLVTRNLNMFTLVGIGTGVAFLFSLFGLLFPQLLPAEFISGHDGVHLYFEATAVILTLVLLGQLLEARAHSKTSGAIKSLLGLTPATTTLIKDGEEKTIAQSDVKAGDQLRIKPGEKVPVDGSILSGKTLIDESMLTGEPIPIEKSKDDPVHSGSINGNHSFVMLAQKVGSETRLAQIIQMVNSASRSRAPIQKLADTIARYFVPTVLAVSILTFILWAAFGPEPAMAYALVNAIAVLIISCPCALGLATPMAVMVGIGKGAQSGVLIKDAGSLEHLHKIDTLITDKTGTLTEGKPSVLCSYPADNTELLSIASALASHSEHPLSKAILREARAQNVSSIELTHFSNITGKGVLGESSQGTLAMGNVKLLEQLSIEPGFREEVEAFQSQGNTVSYVCSGDTLLGFIVIADPIKESSAHAIQELQQAGTDVIMMTGDNVRTAHSVANKLGIDTVHAGCLPEDKLAMVKQLQEQGHRVAMIGDGINDSPALSQADIGIAMGTGTDVAMESAEITLVDGKLTGLTKAMKLSASVLRNIKQNLFFAFFYNALGVPIAAGILYPHFGILLSPMIAAAAMSCSSVSVISNSLRLRNAQL